MLWVRFLFLAQFFVCISMVVINAASEHLPILINCLLQFTSLEGSGNYNCAFLATVN